jgi:hypothetical protein
MADEKTPVEWYAVVSTGSDPIQPYLARLLRAFDRTETLPFEQDGQKRGKLTYSGFVGYADYEGVLRETRELASVLTGTLRIRQGPGPLSIVNIIGIFDDGREEKFPPHGRPRSAASWGMPTLTRKPGAKPRPTTEQFMVEYVIRSGDPLVKDVSRYMSRSPDFFDLFKVLEVIGWDLGKGSKSKGYRRIRERGWVIKKRLKDFKLTAEDTYRHWNKDHPSPHMDLQEARIMFSRIIEEWIAERAGLQLPPMNMRGRLESLNSSPRPPWHRTFGTGPPMTLANTAAVRVRLHRVIARLASIRSSPIPPRCPFVRRPRLI